MLKYVLNAFALGHRHPISGRKDTIGNTMLRFVFALLFVSVGSFSTAALAEEFATNTADMKDLSEFKWKKRPVVVFADSTDNPAFIEQMALLKAQIAELDQRDVVVLVDTDPSARLPLRLKMRPRGFMLVLVGKDGGIKLRKPFPWSVREISRSIDKMPMRQREIREQNAASAGR